MTKTELTNTKLQLDDTKAKLDDTKAKLDDTKDQLDAALKQINSLAVLMNAQLHPGSCVRNIRFIQLDAMVAMFKYICPAIVKMEGYNENKVNNVMWYSDPFYSHNKGYKMCLNVYAGGNGDGEGTHLSVFLALMKGPHDDELTWPLRGAFEIKLLNQIRDSKHCSMILTYDANNGVNRITESDRSRVPMGWRYQKYISNAGLHKITPSCQYLKEDCVFFQVIKV